MHAEFTKCKGIIEASIHNYLFTPLMTSENHPAKCWLLLLCRDLFPLVVQRRIDLQQIFHFLFHLLLVQNTNLDEISVRFINLILNT